MFSRKRKPSRAEPVELDQLITIFGQATNYWGMQTNIQLLVRARFADACRDANVRPVTGLEFRSAWERLDSSDQKRFALSVSAFEVDEIVSRKSALCRGGSAVLLLTRLVDLCKQLPLLTLEVLQQSDIRLEEFARHFCAAWNLPIQGEKAETSQARLKEIDFGRLMQEAEAARGSAQERMAYLRELQEEEEASRRPRRGKW